jgi:hypothetical protein
MQDLSPRPLRRKYAPVSSRGYLVEHVSQVTPVVGGVGNDRAYGDVHDRAWWHIEAARVGSDWGGVLAFQADVRASYGASWDDVLILKVAEQSEREIIARLVGQVGNAA